MNSVSLEEILRQFRSFSSFSPALLPRPWSSTQVCVPWILLIWLCLSLLGGSDCSVAEVSTPRTIHQVTASKQITWLQHPHLNCEAPPCLPAHTQPHLHLFGATWVQNGVKQGEPFRCRPEPVPEGGGVVVPAQASATPDLSYHYFAFRLAAHVTEASYGAQVCELCGITVATGKWEHTANSSLGE